MADQMATSGAPAHEARPLSPARRAFLTRLSVILGGISAAIIGVPIVGFLLAPLFRRPLPYWRNVGIVTGFAVGETRKVVLTDPSPLPWAGLASQTAIWLRRESLEEFVAFSVNCTHLGCPVRWLAGADLFLCPCHGGAFYKNGAVAAGPPREPLVQYPVRVQGGVVQVLSGVSPIIAD